MAGVALTLQWLHGNENYHGNSQCCQQLQLTGTASYTGAKQGLVLVGVVTQASQLLGNKVGSYNCFLMVARQELQISLGL